MAPIERRDSFVPMILFRIAVLVVLLPFRLIARLLHRRKDMVYLPHDHDDMKRAITEARTRLGEFRKTLEARAADTTQFALKVRYPVAGGHEHIWVGDIETRGSSFHGKIANDPQNIAGVRLGSEVEVDESTISDWAYFRGRKAHGHFTTRALLPHASRKMRVAIHSAMGWSETELELSPPLKS